MKRACPRAPSVATFIAVAYVGHGCCGEAQGEILKDREERAAAAFDEVAAAAVAAVAAAVWRLVCACAPL